MEAALTFIDFRKAFDSVVRVKMFQILEACGIPSDVIAAIRIMYENTSAVVLTPEGENDQFMIVTGVLEGYPLAPFLFIICLDYALRTAISDSDGLMLKHRRSRHYPAETLADLDYADDIALLERPSQPCTKGLPGCGFILKCTKNQVHAPGSYYGQPTVFI